MLNVNIWVMASVILEFITVPPFQRTRGFRTPSSRKNTITGKYTDGSEEGRPRSQSLGEGFDVRNSISSRSSGSDEEETSSNDTGDSHKQPKNRIRTSSQDTGDSSLAQSANRVRS